MVKIAQAKIEAMETHPGLAWLRREDADAMAVTPGRKQYRYEKRNDAKAGRRNAPAVGAAVGSSGNPQSMAEADSGSGKASAILSTCRALLAASIAKRDGEAPQANAGAGRSG